jgi:ATP synthase protein I
VDRFGLDVLWPRSLFLPRHFIERQTRCPEGGMAMTQGEESNGRGGADHTNEGRSADDDAVLRARLSKLSNALQQHRDPAEPNVPELSGESLGASNLGFRVLVEFISAIAVGALIGWQIDKWLHTGPILLILFLLLGMAAGMVNIYRIAAGPKPKRD